MPNNSTKGQDADALHRATAAVLEKLYSERDPETRDARRAASTIINRAARIFLGAELRDRPRPDVFLEAVRAAQQKRGEADPQFAANLREDLDRWGVRIKPSGSSEGGGGAAPQAANDATLFRPANLPPGEDEHVYCLIVEKDRPAERLRKGDRLSVWTNTRPLDCDLAAAFDEEGAYIGRLSYDAEGFTLRDGDELHEFEAGFGGLLGRVLHAERRGKIVQRFYTIPLQRQASAPDPAIAAKIKELRGRLESLRDSDDWADVCGGKGFQLEKQIQDLEREAAAGQWPEYIKG